MGDIVPSKLVYRKLCVLTSQGAAEMASSSPLRRFCKRRYTTRLSTGSFFFFVFFSRLKMECWRVVLFEK